MQRKTPSKAETVTISPKTEIDKKMRKACMIANGVLYSLFGGAYFFVATPFYNYNVDWKVTAITLGSFIGAVAAANLAIYSYYKRQMPKGDI